MACLFFPRRLGVELGRSVVFQEPNSGKADVCPHVPHFLNECLRLMSCGLVSAHLTFHLNHADHFFLFVCFSETRVDVKESVRGQDIFIIQTIPR